MLTGLRKSTETWLGRLILSVALGLIIVSFAIWGIGNIFQGFGASEAASVGQTRVSASGFRRAYEAQMERLRMERITPAQALAMGLDRQILLELVANAALTERARTLGLAVAPEQVKKHVLDDPSFKGPSGTFDPNTLNRQLVEQGYTQKDLPAIYMRRQIEAALMGGLRTPNAVLEIFNRYAGEKRHVDYLVLTDADAGDIANPSDAELQTFYQGRRANFRAREYRDILLLTLTPQSLAKPDKVSDEEAHKLYDEVADGRFGQAERRAVQQLSFPNEADAKAALAKIKAGTSFGDIAKERHLAESSVELGAKSKSELGDLGDAAFALPQGGVSEPVKVASGFVLVRVTRIAPSTLKPFAQVAPELKATIARSRVRQADVDELHDKIEALRSSGKPLAEAAKAVSLAAREIPAIDSAGHDKSGAPVPNLTEAPALLKAVFASDVGLDNDTIQSPSGGYEWFEIRKVEPARERTFAEVKLEVEKQWRSTEASKRLSVKAAELLLKLKGGTPLASLVPGAAVKSAEGITRMDANKLPQKVLDEAFVTAVGSGGVVQNGDDTRILFKVTGATPPAFDPNSAEARRNAAGFANVLNREIVRQYAAKLEDSFGLTVNQSVLRTAAEGGERQPLSIDPE